MSNTNANTETIPKISLSESEVFNLGLKAGIEAVRSAIISEFGEPEDNFSERMKDIIDKVEVEYLGNELGDQS